MHFVDKGTDSSKGGRYLVSDRSIRNYGEAWWRGDTTTLSRRPALGRWRGLQPCDSGRPSSEKTLETSWRRREPRLAEVEAKVGRLIQLAEGSGDIPQLKDRLDSLRQEADTLKKAKQDLQEQLYVASSGAIALQETQDDLKRVLARLAAAGRPRRHTGGSAAVHLPHIALAIRTGPDETPQQGRPDQLSGHPPVLRSPVQADGHAPDRGDPP